MSLDPQELAARLKPTPQELEEFSYRVVKSQQGWCSVGDFTMSDSYDTEEEATRAAELDTLTMIAHARGAKSVAYTYKVYRELEEAVRQFERDVWELEAFDASAGGVEHSEEVIRRSERLRSLLIGLRDQSLEASDRFEEEQEQEEQS